MKKFLMLGFTFLLLTGCEGNKLECEKAGNYLDGVYEVDSYEIKFSGDNIKHIEYEKDMDVTGYMLNNMEYLKQSYTYDFEKIKSKYTKLETKIEQDEIDIKVSTDYNKLSETEKKAFTDINSKLNKKQLQEDLESKGYICE